MPSSAHGPAFFSFPSSCHWLLATGYCLLSASQRLLDRQPHAHRRGRVEVADDGDSPDLVGFEQGVHPGRAAGKPHPAPRPRAGGGLGVGLQEPRRPLRVEQLPSPHRLVEREQVGGGGVAPSRSAPRDAMRVLRVPQLALRGGQQARVALRHSRRETIRAEEPRAEHDRRREHVFDDVVLVLLARRLGHDLAQHHVAAVAVLAPRPGIEQQRFRRHEPVVVRVGCEGRLGRRGEVGPEEVGDARLVIQQLVDGRRAGLLVRVVRQPLPDRVRQGEPALREELTHGRLREELADRGDVESRGRHHRHLRLGIGEAVGPLEDHLPVLRDGDHAGELARLRAAREVGVERAVEVGARHGSVDRRRRRAFEVFSRLAHLDADAHDPVGRRGFEAQFDPRQRAGGPFDVQRDPLAVDGPKACERHRAQIVAQPLNEIPPIRGRALGEVVGREARLRHRFERLGLPAGEGLEERPSDGGRVGAPARLRVRGSGGRGGDQEGGDQDASEYGHGCASARWVKRPSPLYLETMPVVTLDRVAIAFGHLPLLDGVSLQVGYGPCDVDHRPA